MIKIRLLMLADRMDRRAKQIARTERLFGITGKFCFNLMGWGHTSRSCGTTACAIGDATLMRAFRRRGLDHGRVSLIPTYRGFSGRPAVEKFFDLTRREAQYLFSIFNYDTSSDPAIVATRLREFVDQGGVASDVSAVF